jgi:hypothetical protein
MTGISQLGYYDPQAGLGYNFVVAIGEYYDFGDRPTNIQQAALIMHELGHNFGLRHDGDPVCDEFLQTNQSPNYLSVMSYDFFGSGIPYSAKPGSTKIVGWRDDYSDVKLPALNEFHLNESAGLQDTRHPTDLAGVYSNGGTVFRLVPVVGPVDFNNNGVIENDVASDVNDDLILTTLPGCNDWRWIHSRLTPPAITSVQNYGYQIGISGRNLMAPATVKFTGGVSAKVPYNYYFYDESPKTRLLVNVPVGAKSGPITVVTREGSATTRYSVTITGSAHWAKATTAGPDGNQWFTQPDGNAVGRITPAGKITEFPLRTPSSEPTAITAGPDGNLWFTEPGASAIGRITPDGKHLREFPLPPVTIAPGEYGPPG